ncbi:unnamed protein product, partial [Adineta steineri]
MNGQSSSNSKHNQTNETDTPTTMPHYDFVLPSYNRDRRLSSTISTVIPDATFNAVSGDV